MLQPLGNLSLRAKENRLCRMKNKSMGLRFNKHRRNIQLFSRVRWFSVIFTYFKLWKVSMFTIIDQISRLFIFKHYYLWKIQLFIGFWRQNFVPLLEGKVVVRFHLWINLWIWIVGVRRSNFMRSKFNFFMRSKFNFFMRSNLFNNIDQEVENWIMRSKPKKALLLILISWTFC